MKVNRSVEFLKCERCGHEWQARGSGASVECPGCKSPYWNKPRKYKLKRLDGAK